MNIKKFEARSIKEALEMVKTQLGPDAVILSAKEVNKGFGLGGVKSVEITAAYSDVILKQKQFVQSRMSDAQKNNFDHVSARGQKEVIQKVMEERIARQQPKKPLFPTTMSTKKYIEIDEDQLPRPVEKVSHRIQQKDLTQQVQQQWNTQEVSQLKSELSELKALIGQFKSMPQNFVQGHPGSEYGVTYSLSNKFSLLTSKGLLPEVAGDILVQAQNQIESHKLNQSNYVDAWIGKYILNSVPVVTGGFEQIHLFMGPSGSGKTSSMIKLASYLSIQHKKRVALISTDTIKVGAEQQMKIFSEILNLPFIAVRNPNDWNKIIPYLSQIDHVLVDFASFSLRHEDEYKYLRKMMPPVYESLRTHLVLSSKSKDAEILDMNKRYEKLNITDVIFTALDEAIQYGSIYNFVRQTNRPLFGFGIGPKVPDDFEKATPERVVDLLLNLTKNSQGQDIGL